MDHLTLLRNAVTWATNEEPPVTVTGPGVLDVTVWRQKDSLTVHLVNLTNPMMMKGPIRELIPVGEQTVRLRLSRRHTAEKGLASRRRSGAAYRVLGRVSERYRAFDSRPRGNRD